MYERILVAVDGGPSSDLAVAHAAELAKAFSAEVKVLYVVDDSDLFFEPSYTDPEEIRRGLVKTGNAALASAAQKLGSAGLRYLTELAERPVAPGQLSATIVERADRWAADLIVMGTHGRRGVRRVVMGSVSEGVVARTNKPVLLLREIPQ